MAKFKVGEIAIVTNSCIPEFPVGCEVEILEIMDPQPWPGCQYLVHIEAYRCVYGNDDCLRKKRPPQRDGLGSWNEIEELTGWNPTKEQIEIISFDEFGGIDEDLFRKILTDGMARFLAQATSCGSAA